MLPETLARDELSPEERQAWRDFHSQNPNSHPWQTLWFNESGTVRNPDAVLYGMARDQHQHLLATAQMHIFKLPFGFSHGVLFRGPTCRDTQTLVDFLPFLIDEARRTNLAWLRVAPYFQGVETEKAEAVLKQLGFHLAPDNIGYVITSLLDLSKPLDELFEHFESKLRWQIRRIEKTHPEIRTLQTSAELKAAVEIGRRLAHKKGITALRPEVLEFILRKIQEDPKRGMARGQFVEGKLVSFVLLVATGDQIWYELGASDPEVRSEGRTHLLLWSCIEEAKRLGFRRFNLGGMAVDKKTGEPQGGVSEFKKRFSGELIRTTPDYLFVLKPGVYRGYRIIQNVRGSLRNALRGL